MLLTESYTHTLITSIAIPVQYHDLYIPQSFFCTHSHIISLSKTFLDPSVTHIYIPQSHYLCRRALSYPEKGKVLSTGQMASRDLPLSRTDRQADRQMYKNTIQQEMFVGANLA